MIKYRTLIIFILLLSISSAVVVYQVNKNYWDIIYDFLLYDHIEYNGISYYSIEDQFNSPSNEYSDEKIIVGIVDYKGRLYYDHPGEAHTYVGDDEHKYLYFDSAIHGRIDQLTPEDIKRHNIKSEDIETAKNKLKETYKDIDAER